MNSFLLLFLPECNSSPTLEVGVFLLRMTYHILLISRCRITLLIFVHIITENKRNSNLPIFCISYYFLSFFDEFFRFFWTFLYFCLIMLTFKQNHLLFTMKYNYLSKLKKKCRNNKKTPS